MPNLTRTWGKWQQDTIWNERDWYLWSVAYKWLDEKKIYFYDLPSFKLYKKDKYSDEELTKKLWELFDEADVVVAHNGNAFDVKKANALFLRHHLLPPTPYKQVDTKLVAKRYFKFDSNKLDDLGNFLKIGRKLPNSGKDLWRGCEQGDKKSWNEMRKYNIQDVALLEKIYLRLLPYMTNHPNINLYANSVYNCPNCGSNQTQKRGYRRTRVSIFQQYQCQSCGAWSSAENVNSKKDAMLR